MARPRKHAPPAPTIAVGGFSIREERSARPRRIPDQPNIPGLRETLAKLTDDGEVSFPALDEKNAGLRNKLLRDWLRAEYPTADRIPFRLVKFPDGSAAIHKVRDKEDAADSAEGEAAAAAASE